MKITSKIKRKNSFKEKLDRIFSEYIRLRDSDEDGFIRCYCCGKILHWKQSQNMHFIPRQHLGTRFSEINCHAGCIKCNYYNNGNIEEYAVHLKKDYGDNITDKLLLAKKTTTKISDFSYQKMIDFYKVEVEKLKKEKGL